MENQSQTPVVQVADDATRQTQVSGELAPFLEYLGGERGHTIASRVLAIVESVQHSTLDKAATNTRVEKVAQVIIILAVISATTYLVVSGKFEASVGVLFGTLVGYVFGKK